MRLQRERQVKKATAGEDRSGQSSGRTKNNTIYIYIYIRIGQSRQEFLRMSKGGKKKD